MKNLIVKTTDLALKIIGEYVTSGDTVIDATCGNGYDTIALANMVGPSGKVYAFDIQKSAIENTRKLVESKKLSERCIIIRDSHHRLCEWVPEIETDKVSAVIFNLGYLPGGDKEITTINETTLQGVCAALSLLKPDGIVAITMYSGHTAGEREKNDLLEFSKELPDKKYHVAYINYLNQNNQPPEILIITKKYQGKKLP